MSLYRCELITLSWNISISFIEISSISNNNKFKQNNWQCYERHNERTAICWWLVPKSLHVLTLCSYSIDRQEEGYGKQRIDPDCHSTKESRVGPDPKSSRHPEITNVWSGKLPRFRGISMSSLPNRLTRRCSLAITFFKSSL